MPKLKVFRTSTGFHDAYVAAASQKAALVAWGTDSNLFAQGLAEQVTDEALMADALAQPGVVIKKSRGTEAEHFAALGPMPEKAKAKPAAKKERASPPPKLPKPKPVPRPSRDALDAADAALEHAIAVQKEALASIKKQVDELRKEQRRLEMEQKRERAELEKQALAERERYDAALEKWRDG